MSVHRLACVFVLTIITLLVPLPPGGSAAATSTPTITSLSASSLARSGRLVISGSGFGATRMASSVQIASVAAPVSTWSDTAITAYVPESTPLGPVGVQVVTAAGSSNPVSLQVTTRQANGRIAWRFDVDAMYIQSRPVTGTDGTVYANDIAGHLYALTPDGGLKWVLNGAGDAGIAIGPDNTVYVGSTSAITSVNADGTIKWQFTQIPGSLILLGPGVGPDGNIYAVATSGIGIFSLTPQGQLRWTLPEAYDRAIVDYQELSFGPSASGDLMYFHANHHFKGVSLDGKLVFTIVGDGSQPVVGPDGTVYTHNGGTAAGGVLGAYAPSGSLLSTFYVSPNNVRTNPEVGPNGAVYVGWNLSYLYALSPKLVQLWKYTDSGILQDPIASPLGTLVFVAGQPNYGQPGFFSAVGARRGRLLWKVSLPLENGLPIYPFSRARFSPDGTKAYISAIISGVYDHSFLYAVSTS
jgi:IPT/TIG domain/PQQ-like domain